MKLFRVESLETFHSCKPASPEVVEEPSEIPAGWQATYREPGGGVVYVLDQSIEAGAE